MFTQTHLLVGAALFARPGARAAMIAGLAGAIIPDADIWLMYAVERLSGSTGCEVFHYRYWQEPWTTLQSILNAFLLYAGMLVVALLGSLAAPVGARRTFQIVAIFALSSLLHVATDFLLHHEDARAQWLPITDWVFRSPVSYWDPNHYGQVFAVFEIGIAIGLIGIVGRRYARLPVWFMLCFAMVGYSGSVAASFLELADHDKGPGSCEIAALIEK